MLNCAKIKEKVDKEHIVSENENRFGAEVFSEQDLDVLEDVERIEFIFDVAEEFSAGYLDLVEFKKYYALLEKGYKLSEYQKRRISNAHLFARKKHERLVEIVMQMREKSEELLKNEDGEKISAFSAFDPE